MYLCVKYIEQNGLTPMHLCAQEDKHKVAAVLDNYHADVNPETKVIKSLYRRVAYIRVD